jgi:hypothetical protein
MNGSERNTKRDRRSKNKADARKHQLAELVRYLARRAAERDYAAMQLQQSGTDRPRESGGNDR